MDDLIQFSNRKEFRTWLIKNSLTSPGVWLLFDKSNNSTTLKASEALEEALCFGWIDGQLKSINDKNYKKYFCMRRKNSKWSQKNKDLVKKLEERGLMTDLGKKKIEEAKQNGQWDTLSNISITEEQINVVTSLLKNYEPAYTNFLKMPLSVKKTYSRAYFDAKTNDGRQKRITWIVNRLNKNLKPM